MAEGKYVVEVEGIDGTYKQKPASNGILTQTWNYSAQSDVNFEGGKATRGRAYCQPITIYVSDFSTKMHEQLLKSMWEKNEKGKKVTIWCLENIANEDKEYRKVEMKDAHVVGVQSNHDQHGQHGSFTLAYKHIKFHHKDNVDAAYDVGVGIALLEPAA